MLLYLLFILLFYNPLNHPSYWTQMQASFIDGKNVVPCDNQYGTVSLHKANRTHLFLSDFNGAIFSLVLMSWDQTVMCSIVTVESFFSFITHVFTFFAAFASFFFKKKKKNLGKTLNPHWMLIFHSCANTELLSIAFFSFFASAMTFQKCLQKKRMSFRFLFLT